MVSLGYINRCFGRSLLMAIKTVCLISSCISPLEVGGYKVNTDAFKSLRTHRFHSKLLILYMHAYICAVKVPMSTGYNRVFFNCLWQLLLKPHEMVFTEHLRLMQEILGRSHKPSPLQRMVGTCLWMKPSMHWYLIKELIS